jgi:hypothetical protein
MVGLSLIPVSDKGYEFTVRGEQGFYDPRIGTWVNPRPLTAPLTSLTPETIRMGTGVTRQQAMNPTYALNWMASKLSNDYRRYGNWETAIIGAASPSGAQYFAENQTFETDYELAFLSDVLTFANNSSLMDPVIDLDRIRAIADAYARSRGGGGPSIPAYQAPDPAEVRNYARDMIEQVLKRKATPVEINSAFTVINDLFRKQYQAKVQSMQGAETTEVNPEERFEEALRTSGEGQFREQATETGSVMSYAGQIARIFQEGY